MYRELALSAFGDNGMNQRDTLLETKDLFSVFTAPYIDQTRGYPSSIPSLPCELGGCLASSLARLSCSDDIAEVA